MASKQKQATDISQKERQAVYDRDNKRCIICGSNQWLEVAHYIGRSQGGMGIRQNLVCLCKTHHMAYDGDKRDIYRKVIHDYLQGWYQDWNEQDLVYDKYGWLK